MYKLLIIGATIIIVAFMLAFVDNAILHYHYCNSDLNNILHNTAQMVGGGILFTAANYVNNKTKEN